MNRTMTVGKLQELLEYSETSLCDFKREIYKMDTDGGKISLLKDILSMANTIREEPAYIIVGISEENNTKTIYGLDKTYDENTFITYLKGQIAPDFPEFAYYTFKYKKNILGIFEIGISNKGPFSSNKDFGQKVLKDKIYYRCGSSNTEASEKTLEEIKQWMSGKNDDNYTLISEKLLGLNTKEFNYVLILGDDYPFNTDQYNLISRVDWSVIVDLKKNSESSGFYKEYHKEFEKRRSIHLITPNDKSNHVFYENRSMMWIMAGGEFDPNAMPLTARGWVTRYSKHVRNALENTISYSKKSFVYIDLYSDDKKNRIENIIYEMEDKLFERFIQLKWNPCFTCNEDYGQITIDTTATSIFNAIKNDVTNRELSIGVEYLLPTKNGAVQLGEVTWIQEEIEPVYLNCDSITAKENEIDFFRGGILHWSQMNPHIAVTRNKLNELKEEIRYQLSKANSFSTISLDYQSGSGATTVLRMLAWELHEECPTLIIQSLSSNTYMRIKAIYDTVDKAKLLLIIDNPIIDNQMVDDLKTKLHVEGVQAIIVQSRRHINNSTRADYLSENLTKKEANGFYKVYLKQLDSIDISEDELKKRQDALYGLTASDNSYSTPFMYALTTFEGLYTKIKDYVEGHLKGATEEQENIFKVVSTIQYYTGLAVPEVLLKHSYENVTGRSSVKNKLTDQQNLLISRVDGDIRMVHQSIAKETLIYLCGISLINKEAWKNNLESIFEYVIDIFKQNSDNKHTQMIITKLFLQQASTNNDTHFSEAIDDLNTNIAKRRVFDTLKTAFPDNAYVYSNLARYYYYVEWNPDKALELIRQAISIEENYTFYHIQGLIYARRFRKFIQNADNYDFIKDQYEDFVSYLKEQKKLVVESYDKSIEKNYDNEYSYVAKMGFYFAVIRDYKSKFAADKKISELIKTEKYYWCSDLIKDINDLISSMKTLMEYTSLSFQVEDYESQIYELIGNLSEAINNWNNLLVKKDIYRPSIRQNIVDGYYSLSGKNWRSNFITDKRKATIIKLLEDNIVEERDNYRRILQWYDFCRNYEGNLSKAVRYFETVPNRTDLQFYFHGMTVLFAYGLTNQDASSITLGVKYASYCERLARTFPYRNYIREAYDPTNKDILKIVKRKGEIDNFLSSIKKIDGRVESIDRTETGKIVIPEYGISLKFNPSRNKDYIFRRDKDENRRVKFVLGFTYEGPYAYEVEPSE